MLKIKASNEFDIHAYDVSVKDRTGAHLKILKNIESSGSPILACIDLLAGGQKVV